MLRKPVEFEWKNSLWIQNAYKTSPMSFHVDIPVRCLIFSNFETFCKNRSLGGHELTGNECYTIKGLFIWRRASPVSGLARFTEILALHTFFVKKLIEFIWLGGLEKFSYKTRHPGNRAENYHSAHVKFADQKERGSHFNMAAVESSPDCESNAPKTRKRKQFRWDEKMIENLIDSLHH